MKHELKKSQKFIWVPPNIKSERITTIKQKEK